MTTIARTMASSILVAAFSCTLGVKTASADCAMDQLVHRIAEQVNVVPMVAIDEAGPFEYEPRSRGSAATAER